MTQREVLEYEMNVLGLNNLNLNKSKDKHSDSMDPNLPYLMKLKDFSTGNKVN